MDQFVSQFFAQQKDDESGDVALAYDEDHNQGHDHDQNQNQDDVEAAESPRKKQRAGVIISEVETIEKSQHGIHDGEGEGDIHDGEGEDNGPTESEVAAEAVSGNEDVSFNETDFEDAVEPGSVVAPEAAEAAEAAEAERDVEEAGDVGEAGDVEEAAGTEPIKTSQSPISSRVIPKGVEEEDTIKPDHSDADIEEFHSMVQTKSPRKQHGKLLNRGLLTLVDKEDIKKQINSDFEKQVGKDVESLDFLEPDVHKSGEIDDSHLASQGEDVDDEEEDKKAGVDTNEGGDDEEEDDNEKAGVDENETGMESASQSEPADSSDAAPTHRSRRRRLRSNLVQNSQDNTRKSKSKSNNDTESIASTPTRRTRSLNADVQIIADPHESSTNVTKNHDDDIIEIDPHDTKTNDADVTEIVDHTGETTESEKESVSPPPAPTSVPATVAPVKPPKKLGRGKWLRIGDKGKRGKGRPRKIVPTPTEPEQELGPVLSRSRLRNRSLRSDNADIVMIKSNQDVLNDDELNDIETSVGEHSPVVTSKKKGRPRKDSVPVVKKKIRRYVMKPSYTANGKRRGRPPKEDDGISSN
ncbi:unnamed protein product [Ambrosiozyma monospora]|uniref:Unnamed protein product n=1 Tax=Ambrosiozyma monospora TaxID=43982 RepID=A0ACB5TCS2_AMBMO|nr:unnamed protein product [Ambrosiozyma monospora]